MNKMTKLKENKGKQGQSLSGTATRFALKPGDYELGSAKSRAAARSLAEAKRRPAEMIQIILVSPDGQKEKGPLIEIFPM
jgi:hypothetical protein